METFKVEPGVDSKVKSIRVLLVDDNSIVLQMLKENLDEFFKKGNLTFDIKDIEVFESALNYVKSNSVELAILDGMGCRSYLLAREIKKTNKNSVVISFSSKEKEELNPENEKGLFDYFFSKPMNINLLNRSIKQALNL